MAAGTGTDPHASPVIDSGIIIEDLFPIALRQAVIAGARKDAEAGALKRDHTVTVTNGVGALPDTVVDECLDMSSVYSSTDADFADLCYFASRYMDYVRPIHSQLGAYAVQGSSFLFREPGGNASEYDGDVHLVAVSLPDIPASITGAMTIGTETAERTIQILAQMVRG